MSDHVNRCTFEFICTHNTIECFDVVVNERMPASNICTHDEAATCVPRVVENLRHLYAMVPCLSVICRNAVSSSAARSIWVARCSAE
jgi:hypothetical protein